MRASSDDVIVLSEAREARKQNQEQAANVLQLLDSFTESLLDLATETAFDGPWRTWSDREPPGSVLEVTREMLAATGHTIITELLRLVSAVEETRDAVASVGQRREP